jgi:hypothetical protein
MLAAVGISGFLLIGLKRQRCWDVVFLGIGCCAGIVSLLGWFLCSGTLQGFMRLYSDTYPGKVLLTPLDVLLLDKSTLAQVSALLVVGLTLKPCLSRFWWFCLIYSLAVPMVLYIYKHYHIFYGWMPLLGTSLCMGVLVPYLPTLGAVRRWIVLLAVALSIFMGTPAGSLKALAYGKLSGQTSLDGLVSRHVAAGSFVVADTRCYYALREAGATGFYLWYLFIIREHERDNVGLIIGPPDFAESARKVIGGRWECVEELQSPEPPTQGLWFYVYKFGTRITGRPERGRAFVVLKRSP